jgi:hypothetical protein
LSAIAFSAAAIAALLLAAEEQDREQDVIAARVLRLELDAAARRLHGPHERRRIARPRAEAGHVFAPIQRRQQAEAGRKVRIERGEPLQPGAHAHMRHRVERAQRFGRLEQAAIARVEHVGAETLGAVVRRNDAERLRHRVRELEDDPALGVAAPVGVDSFSNARDQMTVASDSSISLTRRSTSPLPRYSTVPSSR